MGVLASKNMQVARGRSMSMKVKFYHCFIEEDQDYLSIGIRSLLAEFWPFLWVLRLQTVG
jgi:hypothetical protein